MRIRITIAQRSGSLAARSLAQGLEVGQVQRHRFARTCEGFSASTRLRTSYPVQRFQNLETRPVHVHVQRAIGAPMGKKGPLPRAQRRVVRHGPVQPSPCPARSAASRACAVRRSRRTNSSCGSGGVLDCSRGPSNDMDSRCESAKVKGGINARRRRRSAATLGVRYPSSGRPGFSRRPQTSCWTACLPVARSADHG